MTRLTTLGDVRREYGNLSLNEETALPNPFLQFKLWFEEVLAQEKSDPTAMVLSTVDSKGLPDSRVVLLKGLEREAFVFYTNYESNKAMQLQQLPYAALNFYWPGMARQVRIRGRVKRTSNAQSDRYFSSRPVTSQLSALASPQSREIADRNVLETAFNQLVEKYSQKTVVRPDCWGGYLVIAEEIEFWQGRDNRLHDRIHYFKQQKKWHSRRLAP